MKSKHVRFALFFLIGILSLSAAVYLIYVVRMKADEAIENAIKRRILAAIISASERSNEPKTFAEDFGWKPEEYFEDARVIALCRALNEQDVPKVKQIIVDGADAKAIGKESMTPLLWAFGTGNEELFKVLLDHGADANVVFDWRSEDYFEGPQIMALCDAMDEHDIPKIEQLIADGVDVNTVGRENMTPLRWARIKGYDDLNKLLRDHGAIPNATNKSIFNSRYKIEFGDSVVWLCAGAKSPKFLQHALESGGEPNFCNRFNNPVIFRALSRGTLEHVKLLMDAGADIDAQREGNHGTPMLEATVRGRLDLAIMFLEAGADHTIYADGPSTDVVLFLAREVGQFNFTEAGIAKRKEFMTLLEAKGVDFEAAKAELEIRRKDGEEISFREHPRYRRMHANMRKRAQNAPWLMKEKDGTPEQKE